MRMVASECHWKAAFLGLGWASEALMKGVGLRISI